MAFLAFLSSPVSSWSRKRLLFFVILGLGMSLVAWFMDLHDFVETPWYLWVFVPVCSGYPLLLALNYLYFWRFRRFQPLLLHFTLYGIIGYGVIAPLFYAFYMVESGFSWYEFGNIFWVWIYAAQAFFLWPARIRLTCWQLFLIVAYFFTKDFLDRFSVTWSYVRFGVLSSLLMNTIFVLLLLIHSALFVIFLKKRSVDRVL